MRMLQNTLKQLGWPVDRMSFRQIAQELYRRWFQTPPDGMEEEQAVSAASAAGIVVALASEGNLNALCWADETPDLRKNPVLLKEKEIFFRDSKKGPRPQGERRGANRVPGKEIVCWSYPDDEGGAGFLVDYSAGGIAFVTEKDRSPRVGSKLSASIQSRSSQTVDLGSAIVVRSEALTPDLSLTCLRLDAQRPELIQ